MKEIKLPQPFFFEKGKRAVLLLHAYTGSSNDVRLLGRTLERKGYTVYAPQFTGHATERFEDILDEGSPQQWLADGEAATAFLRSKGYEDIAVMGLSMGGIIATRLLETGNYIGGGSFNSPVLNIGDSKVPAAFVNYYRTFNKHIGKTSEEIEGNIDRIKEKLGQQLAEIREFTDIVQADLDKITGSYYIASSGKDELIDYMNGRVLRDAINHATVDFQFFPESTHVITVGSKRDDFEASVINYLDKLNWKEENL
ncbi:hypothetical protein BW721_02045 [Jeotgalibaca sp. PTS2502]|uniref:alpha/beta hydrolase n=1 Tax=Jeotgalibaca sp. PTS2502 TaxID=1903686 RepID=UPI000973DBA8|nr:alpha/beta fold hydrolase [Jeotgalibaca sp. PTS2502]APZ48564.1 hypothetical protein BW721_02045 [Jeotgalibaca sp. PTS2502]